NTYRQQFSYLNPIDTPSVAGRTSHAGIASHAPTKFHEFPCGRRRNIDNRLPIERCAPCHAAGQGISRSRCHCNVVTVQRKGSTSCKDIDECSAIDADLENSTI